MKVGFRVLLVTDRKAAPGGDIERVVSAAIEGGIRAVQLREKDLPGLTLFQLAERLRRVTADAGAVFVVNDRVDVAMAVGADGVHLGRASIPPSEARRLLGERALVGFSAHSSAEVAEGEKQGADYASFGPVYATPSKRVFGPPAGLGALGAACKAARIPVFAIGGIDAAKAEEALAAGAHGIAVISAVVAASDPRAAAAELVRAVEAAGRARTEVPGERNARDGKGR